MSDPIFFSQPAFILAVDKDGDELDIARSAWVSTKGQRAEDEADTERVEGLINFLMRERHGSPFEQVGLRFLTKTSILVWREHMRHRIASYNEQSGRYSKPEPEFYIVSPNRPLVQQGKVGAYSFVEGNLDQYEQVAMTQANMAIQAWDAYESMLSQGVAKEVARMHLPPTLYSSAYVKMNLRALMNFLSLRSAGTAMYEIRYLAELYETCFSEHFPVVYEAWNANGRVAP
jgi:thymidylate synthase (FAD)